MSAPEYEHVCDAIDAWAALMSKSKDIIGTADSSEFERAWRMVRLNIAKSCLLDRMLNGGEKPSKTPCPVHQGRWSGIHLGWPGQTWSSVAPIQTDPMLVEWREAGCRCNQHRCGCTTGWQPDEACGCATPPNHPQKGSGE